MSVVDVLPSSPPTTFLYQSCTTLKFPTGHDNTPDDSPASFPGSSSLGSRKRVEFRDLNNFQSTYPNSPRLSTAVKPLPPSRECQPSSKSILKFKLEEDGRSYGLDGPADEKVPFNETMDSIILQLTKNDRLDSVDAYQTLASAVKAYDEIPEEAVLKNKIHILLKHIRRDLAVLDKSDIQPSDSNLLTQALKVAVILVWSESFSTLLPDDFRLFILDRAIQTIVDHTAPKIVIVHYLHLLATQNFRPGLIVSNNRVSRLLDALKVLTNYVKGNGAVSERLLVYQKLMDQARSTMKSKAHCWVEEMLTGMASTISDTRNKALCLGRKACQAFPTSASISHSIRAALKHEMEVGKTLGSVLCRKFEKMLAAKDEPESVPQLWAVVLLLSNSLDTKFSTMPDMKDWLKVIQKCFNSGDSNVRQQANLAWNRFVYIVRPHSASMDIMSMLAKPVAAQMDRCGTDKASKHSQAAAVSSYCNLLYYAFRPAATPEQHTRVWNEYIVKVMRTSFFEKNSANTDIAARILMSMFWHPRTSTKVWNENRAHENSLVEPEELPVVECKWVRSKCMPILELFRILFKYSSWGLSASADQAYISKAWRHFLKAVHEPGKREVKHSKEASGAIEGILKFLSDYHRTRANEPHNSSAITLLPQDVVSRITRIFFAETGVQSVINMFGNQTPHRIEILADALLYAHNLSISDNCVSITNPDASLAGAVPKALHALDNMFTWLYTCACENQPGTDIEALQTLSAILSAISPATLEMAVLHTSKAIAMWIQDDQKVVDDDGSSPDLKPGSPLAMLVTINEQILRHIRTEAVTPLDTVLNAIFNSNHSAVVDSATKLWSKRFAAEEIKLGPLLSKTFSQQTKFLASGFSSDKTNDENELPPHYHSPLTFQTQVDEMYMTDPFEPSCDDHDVSKATAQPTTNGIHNVMAQSSIVPTWDSSPVSKGRARHDDSQVVFAAIGELPLSTNELESQCLTERQKDIRDRQRIEPAVVFPDLRSSPRHHSRPASRSSDPMESDFARKIASVTERPSTPVLENGNEMETGEIEASPTPKARHSIDRLTDFEVPSSPPSVSGRAEQQDGSQDQLSSPLLGARDIGDDVAMQEQQSIDETNLDDEAVSSSDVEVSNDNQLHTAPEYFPGGIKSNGMNPREQDETAVDVHRRLITNSQGQLDGLRYVRDHEFSDVTNMHRDSQVFSDEVHAMSASQLSNDLETHVENELQDAANPVYVENEASNDHLVKSSEDPGEKLSKTRKRKRSDKGVPAENTRSQRRRRTLSETCLKDSSHLSSQLLEEVVDSQSSAVAVSSHVRKNSHQGSIIETVSTANSPVARSTRSRTRKSRQWSQVGEELAIKTPDLNIGAGELDNAARVDTDETECDKTSEGYETVKQFTEEISEVTGGNGTEEASQQPVIDTAVPPLPPNLSQDNKARSTPVNIAQSLQAILNHLRDGTAEPFDLRAVDELCFQIRFQAQTTTQPTSQ